MQFIRDRSQDFETISDKLRRVGLQRLGESILDDAMMAVNPGMAVGRALRSPELQAGGKGAYLNPTTPEGRANYGGVPGDVISRFTGGGKAFTSIHRPGQAAFSPIEELERIPVVGKPISAALDLTLDPIGLVGMRGASTGVLARLAEKVTRATRLPQGISRIINSSMVPLSADPRKAMLMETGITAAYGGVQSATEEAGAPWWVSHPAGFASSALAVRAIRSRIADRGVDELVNAPMSAIFRGQESRKPETPEQAARFEEMARLRKQSKPEIVSPPGDAYPGAARRDDPRDRIVWREKVISDLSQEIAETPKGTDEWMRLNQSLREYEFSQSSDRDLVKTLALSSTEPDPIAVIQIRDALRRTLVDNPAVVAPAEEQIDNLLRGMGKLDGDLGLRTLREVQAQVLSDLDEARRQLRRVERDVQQGNVKGAQETLNAVLQRESELSFLSQAVSQRISQQTLPEPPSGLRGVVSSIMENTNEPGVAAAQGRQDRIRDTRERIGALSRQELLSEIKSYGLHQKGKTNELRNRLAAYLDYRLEIPDNPLEQFAELEMALAKMPRQALRELAEVRNVSLTPNRNKLTQRIIDSFQREAGVDADIRIPNPPRPMFTHITLTKNFPQQQVDIDDWVRQLEEAEIEPSFQSIIDNAIAEIERILAGPPPPMAPPPRFAYTSAPPEERFARTQPISGLFNEPPVRVTPYTASNVPPQERFARTQQFDLGNSGGGRQLPPAPPGGGTQPPLGNLPVPPEKKPPSIGLIRQINQGLKMIWASVDASAFGIQFLPAASRMAWTGDFAGINRVVSNSIAHMMDGEHLPVYMKYHDEVWSKLDPRLSVEALQNLGANWASRSGANDLRNAGEDIAAANWPGIKHGTRLYDAVGDLARLATITNEWQIRGGRKLTDAQLKAIIASANRMTGYSDELVPGQDLFMFAPRFFNSQLEMIVKAFTDGDIEGELARKSLMSMLAIGGMLTWGANEARGEETVFDPRDSNFMRIRNVAGHDVSLLGPWDSLIRAVSRMVVDPQEGATFFARSKSSPIISIAWDLLSGENFMGESIYDMPPERILLNLIAPFGFKDISNVGVTPETALGFMGVKASPLTPTEVLENRMENAGLDPTDPLHRRMYLADHPEDRPKSTKLDSIYANEVREDIGTRQLVNDMRALQDGQTLQEWREGRRKLLTEQRNVLDTIRRQAGWDDKPPETRKERLIDSYFNMLSGSSDPVTGDLIGDKFDKALIAWIGVNGQDSYSYMQSFLMAGKNPLESAYLNDMASLRELGYFDMLRLRNMTSGVDEDTIMTLRQKVSAERAINPRLANTDFTQATMIVLRGYPMAVRRDVSNAGKSAYQNPQVERIQKRYPHLISWFSPNQSYSHYARLSGSPTDPAAMISLEQRRLINTNPSHPALASLGAQ